MSPRWGWRSVLPTLQSSRFLPVHIRVHPCPSVVRHPRERSRTSVEGTAAATHRTVETVTVLVIRWRECPIFFTVRVIRCAVRAIRRTVLVIRWTGRAIRRGFGGKTAGACPVSGTVCLKIDQEGVVKPSASPRPLSRRDIAKIAQRFNAGLRGSKNIESRRDERGSGFGAGFLPSLRDLSPPLGSTQR